MTRTRNRAATSSGRPSAADLAAAHGKSIPDVIAPGLRVLFCGINPGLYSGATGHHFARPGNRFWPALHRAGFTSRQLHPSEQQLLLKAGYGVVNLVNRTTATAAEVAAEEFVAGRARLAAKVRRYRPKAIAFLGVGAYCQAFGLRKASIGLQTESFEGAKVWVLPNPSGLNANYQLPDLVRLFRALHDPAGSGDRGRTPTRPRRQTAMPAISTLHQTLCTAIGERRLLAFSSKGCSRVGEPHDYGVKDRVRKLLYYQVGGSSNSQPPTGWRWAETDEMTGAKLMEERFAGARPAPTGRHVKWDKLFASVSEKG